MAMTIKLVRHGESEANTGKVRAQDVGDHQIQLSARGQEQALGAGREIGADFLRDSLIYVSPYARTRQTLDGIVAGSGLPANEVPRIYEDPRLREVEHGYDATEPQQDLRRLHGWFYYRFRGGESPADCFDRTSTFLESMMRQVERKGASKVLIVTHGLTVRCFVMRFFHLSVEQFDTMANPGNCAIVTLHSGPPADLEGCLYRSGSWGVRGLCLRQEGEGDPL